MPRRSSKKQGPEDINEAAYRVLRETTQSSSDEAESEKNPAAVALGKLGGQKGGKARAAKLTPEQRSEIAKKAAVARWKNKDNKSTKQ